MHIDGRYMMIMFNNLKQLWLRVTGKETEVMADQVRFYWEMNSNLNHQIDLLRTQLRIGESSWEMVCDLIHQKELREEALQKGNSVLENQIVSLEYEKRQMQRLLDAWETRERDQKSEDIRVEDLLCDRSEVNAA